MSFTAGFCSVSQQNIATQPVLNDLCRKAGSSLPFVSLHMVFSLVYGYRNQRHFAGNNCKLKVVAIIKYSI
jgi:hypothetical protein